VERSDTHHVPADGDGFREGLNPSYDLLPDGLFELPDGQITDFLSSPSRKNIVVFTRPKSTLELPPSRPPEGRLAIVTDAGRDAVDAGGASDEGADLRTAKSCGPDASTLASSLRNHPQATVTRKPDHRGEYEGNR
jgi:hypothetical protein